jgi:hypothetical protein
MESIEEHTNLKEDVTPAEAWQYLRETARVIKESNEDLRLRFQETDKKFQDTDKKFQETAVRFQETDKYIKELGGQIGGLHNTFGYFNEGLMIPSIKRILGEDFNCHFVAPNPYFKSNGHKYEVDVLGVSYTACYLVEIKTKYKDDVIDQHNKKLENFNKYEKQYTDLPKYGIIAASNFRDEDIEKIREAGFYFISFAEYLAKLVVFDNFTPKKWI